MNPQVTTLILPVFFYSLLYVAAKTPESVSSSGNEKSQSPQAPVVLEQHLFANSTVRAGVVGGLHVLQSELALPAVNARLLPSAHLASAGNSLAGTRCLARDSAD